MSNEERWALGEACEQGDLKRVEALVNPPSNPTAEVLNYGLSTAASEGHSAVVSFLFDKGAEMTAATTVLAANGHSPAVFQVFLDHGWDINSNGCSRGPILESVHLALGHLKT